MSDSIITKKAIAAGMKELTKNKNFDKITVSDIAEICGLNRQTFYYHFQDKFELVGWIYYNEIVSEIIKDLSYENATDKVLRMLVKMKNEDFFYINTLKASVENEFREYLLQITSELFADIIGRIAVEKEMKESDRSFMADFYAYGIVGTIIAWAHHGMKETPEYITEQLKKLAFGTEKFGYIRYNKKMQIN